MGGIFTPISAVCWIAAAAFLIIILRNQQQEQDLWQIRARYAEHLKQYITATETLNRINASRNRIISAERKAELKKAFTVDKYSMDHSQQNNNNK